ncbi:MAG: hypothetical protein K940chlam6_01685 [Chlamydiae bacterium]|nr:hypothetical protein [Chlamydiota bacterium]
MASLVTIGDLNAFLDRTLEYYDSNGRLGEGSLYPVLKETTNIAEGLLGRVKLLHSKYEKSENKEDLKQKFTQYELQFEKLKELVKEARENANLIEETAAHLPKNSKSKDSKRITVLEDVPGVITEMRTIAVNIETTYLTQAYRTNPYWYLADYMHDLKQKI